MPWNGNGVLEQVASARRNSPAQPIDVDDRSCIDMPEYLALNCRWVGGGWEARPARSGGLLGAATAAAAG
jgi:hypothetical protein